MNSCIKSCSDNVFTSCDDSSVNITKCPKCCAACGHAASTAAVAQQWTHPAGAFARWLSDYQFNLDCIVQVQHLNCYQESTGVAAASWLGSGAARRRILAARGMETAMWICESDDTLANSNSLHSNPLGRGLAWSSLDHMPGAGASWCAAPTTVRSSDGSSMRRTTAVRGQTRKT